MTRHFGRIPFNPLPSSEGRRLTFAIVVFPQSPFNPLPSSEGRPYLTCSPYQTIVLQSTSLIRGKTRTFTLYFSMTLSFNPLPSSEGRLGRYGSFIFAYDPSIHFPHPREDTFSPYPWGLGNPSIHFPHPREDKGDSVTTDILCPSIHFPHPREDLYANVDTGVVRILQSTSLIRGKTRLSERFIVSWKPFNPLPSSEGRRN